jgi:hypothetical protein
VNPKLPFFSSFPALFVSRIMQSKVLSSLLHVIFPQIYAPIYLPSTQTENRCCDQRPFRFHGHLYRSRHWELRALAFKGGLTSADNLRSIEFPLEFRDGLTIPQFGFVGRAIGARRLGGQFRANTRVVFQILRRKELPNVNYSFFSMKSKEMNPPTICHSYSEDSSSL